MKYAIVKSAECITGRHLLETTVATIARAVDWQGSIGRCENLAQLAVEINKLLGSQDRYIGCHDSNALSVKFILVFDGIDRQRDPPATLLPALARLAEIVSVAEDSILLNC